MTKRPQLAGVGCDACEFERLRAVKAAIPE